MLMEGHIKQLRKMVERTYCSKFKNKRFRRNLLEEIMNWVLECIRYSDIITTFDIRRLVLAFHRLKR